GVNVTNVVPLIDIAGGVQTRTSKGVQEGVIAIAGVITPKMISDGVNIGVEVGNGVGLGLGVSVGVSVSACASDEGGGRTSDRSTNVVKK
ncbi:unnamed protein product, partial [Ilex paraguariensis]